MDQSAAENQGDGNAGATSFHLVSPGAVATICIAADASARA